MQDNHSNDFDFLVKSMLADAEIKPSRRVWKGVSARLNTEKAPAAPAWGWVRWAAMGLAAAAVAAVLFLPDRTHSIPTNLNNQPQATLAQAGETADTPTPVEEPAAAPAGVLSHESGISRPIVRKAAEKLPADRPVERPEVAVGSTETAAPGPAAAAPESHPKSTPAAPSAAKSVVTPQPQTDPFAEPAIKTFTRHSAIYAQGSIGSNESVRPAPPAWMAAPGKANGFSELGSSTYGVPFTLGLGVRFYVLPRFSLGSGINYTLLTRTFTGSYDDISGTVAHTVQYLGVPVNLYYDVLSSEKIKFYVYGGGSAEFCVSNKYRLYANPDIIRSYPVSGIQFSVGGGLGVEFQLGQHLGLYLDPGVSYYFPSGQPRSIRTDKPLMLNFDAGLRFNF